MVKGVTVMELEEIYKEYINDLYRYLFSLSNDHYIAEDLVHETFYRAYLVLENEDVHQIKAWLFKVAYHAFIDFKRKNKRLILRTNGDWEEIHEDTPERRLMEEESIRLIMKDLNTLKEVEKNAILLCDFNDFSYQEASDILHLKLNTFKSHLFRGRNKLTTLIKERMREDEG